MKEKRCLYGQAAAHMATIQRRIANGEPPEPGFDLPHLGSTSEMRESFGLAADLWRTFYEKHLRICESCRSYTLARQSKLRATQEVIQ